MKIIKIPFNEILFNQADSAKIISDACARGNWTASGICELSDCAAVILSSGKEDSTGFVFAKFAEENDEGKIAELHDRYRGEFDLLGTFFIDNQLWGLFRKKSDRMLERYKSLEKEE